MNPNLEENTSENQSVKSGSHERRSASWDLRNAFRNYSTLVTAQVAIGIFSFASVWIVTRYLGTEGYGKIVAVIAAAQVAQIFTSWTGVALARYGVEEFVADGQINKSFWARSLILLPNTLLVLGLSFLWLPLLSNWLKLSPEIGWVVLAYFVVMAFWIHIQQALQGAKLPHLQGILLAIERISTFLILVSLVATDKLTYISAILAYIISPFLLSIIGLFQLRTFISWRIELDFGWLKKILKFSIPLIPFSLVGYLSTNYLDAIFISQYLSKSDLGVYSVAYQINGIFLQFAVLAGSLLMPLFVTLKTNDDVSKMNRYTEDLIPILTLLTGFFVLPVILILSFVLPFFFDQSSSEILPVLLILTLSTILAIPGLIGYIPYFNSFSATYIGMISAIISSVVNVVANFVLIPRFGLKGSAWATVLAYGTSFFVILMIVNRQFSLNNKWTIQALVPTIVGIVYYSFLDNFYMAFILVITLDAMIIFIYRKSFSKGIDLIKNYRSFLVK